jgi:flagellar hook-associated protein FlgK
MFNIIHTAAISMNRQHGIVDARSKNIANAGDSNYDRYEIRGNDITKTEINRSKYLRFNSEYEKNSKVKATFDYTESLLVSNEDKKHDRDTLEHLHTQRRNVFSNKKILNGLKSQLESKDKKLWTNEEHERLSTLNGKLNAVPEEIKIIDSVISFIENGSKNYDDFAPAFGSIGVNVNDKIKYNNDQRTFALDVIENRVGVNIDEEVLGMEIAENVYAASAKVTVTVNHMLDSLMTLIR